MRKPASIRAARPDDIDAIIPLNDAAIPAVNAMPREEWERFVREAAYFKVVEGADGRIGGFLICLRPGIAYDSLNFQWFIGRYDDFVYVDRIVIGEGLRGMGMGRALYEDAIAFTQAVGAPVFTAEVNSRPPNPGSMRFHEVMEFVPVGEQDTEGGTKTVALLARPVSPSFVRPV